MKIKPLQRVTLRRLMLAKKGIFTFLVHGIDNDRHCTCGKANCSAPGKHPRFNGTDRGATIDPARIRREDKYRNANIGLHCGRSNLAVIDIDPRNGGWETLAAFEAEHGPLESSVVARTGGGGEHRFFLAPTSGKLPSSLGPGIDVLSGNKYPVIPPSRHHSGSTYKWEEGADLVSARFLLTQLPGAVLHFKAQTSGTDLSEPIAETEEQMARLRSALKYISADCPRNDWRDHLYSLKSTGWESAEEMAREWSMSAPNLWSEDEFERIWNGAKERRPGGRHVASIFYAAKGNGWIDPTAPTRLETLGDISNGRRFAARYRHEFLYDRASRQWKRYDNGIWRACDTGEHIAAAKAIADEILREAGAKLAENPTEPNKAAHSQAMRVHRSAQRVNAIVEMAATEPGMSVADPSAFDANPDLLGVQGGVINLRTGEMLSPSPFYRISRCVGVQYDPTARCSRFESFMSDILANGAQVRFIQRFAGYTLTGSVAEEKLLFMQGTGANGKSVLANILAHILGDYAVTVGFELLAVTKNEGEVSRHKVRLRGARMVLVNEVGQNDTFNDQRLKEVTSREAISARYLYGEGFDFMPTHKIWVRGNHRPAVLDAGDGMWRRLILIPFQRQFEPHEQVRELDREIIEEEGSGILNWCIAGCLAWRERGLAIPKSILRETDQYRADTDVVGEWIENDCKTRVGLRGSVTALYESYREASERAGMTPRSQPAFTRMMTSRGFRRGASNSKSYLSGIDVAGDI